jgi:drug/metabolite transporter (DMT)-like permease
MLLGILLGLGASASWAVANVAIQRSTHAVGALRAALWAQVVGGAGAVLVHLLEHPVAPWTADAAWWAGAGGGAALLAYAGLFVATERGRLSIVVPVVSSWSLLAAAIGIGLLGERLRVVRLAGAGLVVLGVWLVARPAAGAEARPTHERTALLAALAGAVGFGVMIPAIGRLTPAAGALGAVALIMGVELALGLPVAVALGVDVRAPVGAAWRPVLAAGLFEVLGFACVALGTSHAPVAIVAPAASVGGSLTVAWAWLVLRERPGRIALAGAALSAAGVMTLAL